MNIAAIPPLPDLLVPWLKPEASGRLICTQISEREFRVEVLAQSPSSAPGPLAMLGFAKKFGSRVRRTDDVLLELRDGERD
jgi:hypothetical protein